MIWYVLVDEADLSSKHEFYSKLPDVEAESDEEVCVEKNLIILCNQ